MKKTVLSFIITVGFLSAMFAQTDRRTRETKIADIIMLLPVDNTSAYNQLMGELIQLGDVIGDLTPRLLDSGDGDTQLRYAISGLSMYASKDASRKPVIAKSLCDALSKAKSDEIRNFLLIQLQYVAGNESVEAIAQYLNNNRLADAAARALVRIGNDAAGKALLSALDQSRSGTASYPLQMAYVKALGDMRYRPAVGALKGLAATDDVKLRKTVLYSLAMIAEPSSEKILAKAAAKANYRYEPTDALASYILFLRNNFSNKGNNESVIFVNNIFIPVSDNDMVINSAGKMLKATSETSQIAAKSTALELLTLAKGDKAVGDIIGALKSNSKQYRQAALTYSLNIKSEKMYDELMNVAVKEKRADVKAEIITVFGERSNINCYSFRKSVYPYVIECLADGNGIVRSAAIVAAGKLGGDDANLIPHIVKAMNTEDTRVVTAGKNTLLFTKGDQVTSEAASAIPQTSAPARIAFLEILASRKAVAYSETVFAQTSSTDANVRLAAIKALASIAAEKDIPRIAQLLNRISDKAEITALQRAFFAAVSSEDKERQTGLVMEQAAKSNNPGLYANVLAMIGGEKALELVMNQGFNSGDAKLKESAFEALLNWSDGSAMPQLYRIAAGDPSGVFFEKALNAYIAKTGLSVNTPEQKLLMLRNALVIAKTPAQKQTILQQTGRTGAFLGLLTAGKYLDDSNNDVQQAAVQAVCAIALAHPEHYGPEITALLNKAMAVNKDPEADYQKQAILKHLAALPKDEGFVTMFNGKDLAGWKGLVENPLKRANMTPKQLAEEQVKADEIMRRDWKVIEGLLVFEGKGYNNLCSKKDYGDFEMYVDWRITDKGDAGIYLRGSPQVQIWDVRNPNAHVGSGGLYNNERHPKDPLLVADNPANEWNSFYIKMIGEKVIVRLNGQLVVDNITLENFWDRNRPIFEKDAIELQAHGDRVEYRDLYVREIPRPAPYRVSDAEKAEGFVPIFNGIDMSGWIGNLRDYIAVDGMIVCDPTKGGRGDCYTDSEYSDFVLRFEFLLTPAANNGIGIRTPLKGDAAYGGMEIQVLDGESPVYKDIKPYQHHGSVYGVIPAKRGFMKPIGEWNVQEIIADGHRIKVTLNGTVIVDGDLAEASKNFTETMDGNKHAGLSNKSGHIGFLGHGSWVAFRNLRIKELKK